MENVNTTNINTQKDIHKASWLFLNNIESITPREVSGALKKIESYEKLISLSGREFKNLLGKDERIEEKFEKEKKSFSLDKLLKSLETHKISFVTFEESCYPELLKETYNPPKVLFYQGTMPEKGDFLLAVVGSRKMTSYGKIVLSNLIPPLVRSGIGIVSGLAFGIDGVSLNITLEEHGKAFGVIGSGLNYNSFYPKENFKLAEQMIQNGGCVISEYPPETPPLQHYFPARNRIIAGLSKGTLVIEAGENSGSLITAKNALFENREVFAVPGNITSEYSKGTNALIKEGAHLTENAADILSVFGFSSDEETQIKGHLANDPLLQIIRAEPKHIDEIVRALKLTPSVVSARLSELEIKGLVKNVGNMHYIVIKYT